MSGDSAQSATSGTPVPGEKMSDEGRFTPGAWSQRKRSLVINAEERLPGLRTSIKSKAFSSLLGRDCA